MPAVRRHNAASLNLATRIGTPLTTDWYSNEFRRLGAIAHFDPGLGATDDGTTSTWTDQIGGEVVSSTSQATRLVLSSANAALNNRPAWVATTGNSTKLVSAGASTLAGLIDGNAAYTVYIVRCNNEAAAARSIFAVGSTVDGNYIYHGTATTTAASLSGRGAVSTVLWTGNIQPTTNPQIDVHAYSGSVYDVWGNGGRAYTAGAASDTPTSTRTVIGAQMVSGAFQRFYGGAIGDIVIFLGAHADAQRMVVERLLAEKYGWPVLRGVTGFSTSNYLDNAALTSGIRGNNASGVWADVLIRPDAVPSGTQYLASAFSANTGMGLYSVGAVATIQAYNGTTGASGPNRTIAAADVGKLALLGGGAGPANLCRSFWNGAEVGAGTALTGYAKNNAIAFSVGARAAVSPASSFSVFGVCGGDAEQVAANQAARAAAIKAAGRYVFDGGVTATHGWRYETPAAHYADRVGVDMLTRTGTLTETQCIVPTWSW